MKALYWLGLLFTFTTTLLKAQISVMPLLFFDSPWYLTNYASHYGRTPNFRKNLNSGMWGPGIGAFIRIVPFTSNIYLYTGIYNGYLNYGYRFYFPPSLDNAGSGGGTNIFYFPVFINLFDYKVGQKNEKYDEDITPRRTLHLRSYLGFAYTYVPNNIAWNAGTFNLNYSGFTTNEYVHIITNQGISTMAAFSAYIYSNIKSRETFSLSIIYWQGLVNLLSTDVNFSINNNSYHEQIFSKATTIDVVLAYSIPLDYKKWFAHKKQKKGAQNR